MSTFIEELDGEDEPTLWLTTGPLDWKPQPVIRRCDLSLEARHLWDHIVQALIEAGPA